MSFLSRCYHLRRPFQSWSRWRTWIIIIVLSQFLLVLLYVDIIQKRAAPKLTPNTSLVKNTLIQDKNERDWMLRNNIASFSRISDSHKSNKTIGNSLSEMKLPTGKGRPQYTVSGVNFRRINVTLLQKSLNDMLQQSLHRNISPEFSHKSSPNDSRIMALNVLSQNSETKSFTANAFKQPLGEGEGAINKGTEELSINKSPRITDQLILHSSRSERNPGADTSQKKTDAFNDARNKPYFAKEPLENIKKDSDVMLSQNISSDTMKSTSNSYLINNAKETNKVKENIRITSGKVGGKTTESVLHKQHLVSYHNMADASAGKGKENVYSFIGKISITNTSVLATPAHYQNLINPLKYNSTKLLKENTASHGLSSNIAQFKNTGYNKSLTNLVSNGSRGVLMMKSVHSKQFTLQEALKYDSPPNIAVPDTFRLLNNTTTSPYFMMEHEQGCYTAGMDLLVNDSKHCVCKLGYYGKSCSIPSFVFNALGNRYTEKIVPRNYTRRVINAIAFNMEYELLEARLHELNDVVDVFLILESNFSSHGDIKPLRLWDRMRRGFLKEFHNKLLYLFLDHFPEGGRQDGWLADHYLRQYIGREGLRHIGGMNPDDIFIYTDADEIPSRDAVLFLRLHDGFPEPFGFTLRWSVYGFFWHQLEPTRIWAGCTIAMLRYVFNWDAYDLRSGDYWNKYQANVAAYVKTGGLVLDWQLGLVTSFNKQYTGWHCSWCLPPPRIQVKLTSAINADFPRWGDFPEKLDLTYIRGLIKAGTWFDDVTKIGELSTPEADLFYAPTYILKNKDKFLYLINFDDAIKL